ncbi:MAG: hypothetical protein K9N06_13615 [Candidatus Cloacimonetes bacterium]|nr:hypothetical protein [Candidatus Cloacimonadota bacterium]
MSWTFLYYDYINQSDTLFIDPYNNQQNSINYMMIYFLDESYEELYVGYYKLSMEHLIEIIEYTNNDNDLIIDNDQFIMSNYPNPFNPTTTISFSTTEDTENAELEIYNLKG